MKKTLLTLLALVLMGMGVMAQSYTYTKINSASELEVGQQYLLVGYDEALGYCAMSYQKASNRHAIQVAENGGSITLVPASDPSNQTDAYQITLGGNSGAWTLYDAVKGGYLYASSSTANQLKTQTELDANGQWAITFDADGTAELVAQGENTRNVMRFNENSSNGQPLFNCYSPTSAINVRVAFYKAGGTPTVDPEPSEYPTAFMSTVDRTNVTLTWGASGGAQLPRGYVIIGSTGSIVKPVDGTPVENDLNAGDGHVAYNVLFGESSYIFRSLPANTTWHFAIFPYTNSGATIDYKNESGYPTANATIGDIYSLVNTNFSEGLAPFNAISIIGDQSWTTGSNQGIPFAKMSGYASSAAHANEDWLITPNLFMMGKYQTVSVSFKTARNYEGDMLKVMKSFDYDGESDPTDYTWEDITSQFMLSEGSWAWQESGLVTFENVQSSNFYIAYVYTSTDEAASTWEVTDVEIYGTGYDAVAENEAVTFGLYPNPASSNVNIVAESAALVEVMDMAGRVVMSVDVVAGENSISVADLAEGVYFVKMNGAVVKFVKR